MLLGVSIVLRCRIMYFEVLKDKLTTIKKNLTPFMAYEGSKSTRVNLSINPNLKPKLERILIKLYRQNLSFLFNQNA